MTAIARLSPAFESSSTTRRAIYLLIGLVAANLLAWAWAFIEFGANPVLMGTALLAYSLACVMPSMPTISPPSTTSPAS